MKTGYIVVDFGTGNLRVAIVGPDGTLLSACREDITYHRDNRYTDSIFFNPDDLWERIFVLTDDALRDAGTIQINAITATSQREGIVVVDQEGGSLLGMPNIDHRGRLWEDTIADKTRVYELTGRYPTSLFSALKIKGLLEVYPDTNVGSVMSISDWVEYMFSGIPHYEHSQASETLWYDIAEKNWSNELTALFELDSRVLPPLMDAGSILGKVKPDVAERLGISFDATVVVGGADTQLAALSTQASDGDIVIVSGTTTPIVKLTESYITDEKQRTWTGRHVEDGQFMFEANAGVTGLNYQRLKKIFYPNEGYEVIEKELLDVTPARCQAALGSLLADEKKPLLTGGFIFNVPVSHELSRADFVWATLWDIACSIYENYQSLCSVEAYLKTYLWTCGGGMESRLLRQFIAGLTGKEVRIRSNFRYASAVGGAILCNRALQMQVEIDADTEYVVPDTQSLDFDAYYRRWKENRARLKENF